MQNSIKMNLIVAMDSLNGIGKNGKIPWYLQADLKRFGQLTTKTVDETKRNVVLMGRKVWESIPEKQKPLKNRLNIVLSTTLDGKSDESVIIARSFEDAISLAQKRDDIEKIWNIGGTEVYRKGLKSNLLENIYVTFVDGNFDADTFFPSIDYQRYLEKNFPGDPIGVQEENSMKFRYVVFKRISNN